MGFRINFLSLREEKVLRNDVFCGERAMEKRFWVYIVADKPYGTLYLGITSNLPRRSYEHREGIYEGFTKIYGLKHLVYYEEYPTALDAIAREKKLKKWRRDWKIDLVKSFNPTWQDLYARFNQ